MVEAHDYGLQFFFFTYFFHSDHTGLYTKEQENTEVKRAPAHDAAEIRTVRRGKPSSDRSSPTPYYQSHTATLR